MKHGFLSSKDLNIIRGKVMVGAATPTEILKVFRHLDELEIALDAYGLDDLFIGAEGWRHVILGED
jgi:hypothetical protein